MNNGEQITQKYLNGLIYKIIDKIKFEYDFDITTPISSNKYCTVSIDLSNNIISGDEIITSEAITINLSDRFFNTLNYYIKVSYYELNPDIDDSAENPLITYEQELNTGNNTLTFTKNPVYLQQDFKLIIKVWDYGDRWTNRNNDSKLDWK